MVLETDRLDIIPLTYEQLYLLIYDIDGFEKEFNCTYKATPLEDFFLEIVKGQLLATENDKKNYVWHSFFILLRKTDRIVIGLADFKDVPDKNGEVEIGYGLESEFEHKGYMTEAVKSMCEWAFKNDNVNAVIAETDLDGVASQNILTRCGFKKYSENDTCWFKLNK